MKSGEAREDFAADFDSGLWECSRLGLARRPRLEVRERAEHGGVLRDWSDKIYSREILNTQPIIP